MSIAVCGDVHGKVFEFNKLIEHRTSEDDFVVQVGDMGVGFVNVPRFPDNVRFIRGNHDWPDGSKNHYNYLGDYGFLKEYNLFYLAGAWSIDWQWRQSVMAQGSKACWWEDEQLSQEELDKALDLYIQVKPEIVVSHEAPASIVPQILAKNPVKFDINSPMYNPKHNDFIRPEKLECIKTRTSETLQKMLDIYRPKFWCFGHYHNSRIIDTGSTLFKCVEELELFRIPVCQECGRTVDHKMSCSQNYKR